MDDRATKVLAAVPATLRALVAERDAYATKTAQVTAELEFLRKAIEVTGVMDEKGYCGNGTAQEKLASVVREHNSIEELEGKLSALAIIQPNGSGMSLSSVKQADAEYTPASFNEAIYGG
jgi:hypothetical protein